MKTSTLQSSTLFRWWILWISAMSLTGLVATDSSTASELSLVTAKELSDSLNSVVVLDARPLEEWKKGHIPGAVSLSWENYTAIDDKNIPHRVLSPEKFSDALGLKGISETTHVVVYGDADSSWGGEGWVCWVLTWLGHRGVIQLLDGGFQSWKKCDLIVSTSDFEKADPAIYHFGIKKQINISTAELSSATSTAQIVDTRSIFERLKGRIPGSVHISWKNFFRGKEKRPLNREEFIALLGQHDINPGKPVVYYCSGGIRSAYAWSVHQLSGFSNAQNYEGGMEAWKRLSP